MGSGGDVVASGGGGPVGSGGVTLATGGAPAGGTAAGGAGGSPADPGEKTVEFNGSAGETLRLTAYGDSMVRLQVAQSGEDFYPNDRYEMVERHDWDGGFQVVDDVATTTLTSGGVIVTVQKDPLRVAFALAAEPDVPLLAEQDGVSFGDSSVTETFVPTAGEHFAGLGHPAYGRLDALDRAGTSLTVSAGSEGALVAPFFLSSRGYGVFLNTTFTHTISLGASEAYSLSIDGEGFGGQMDYFFIGGPELPAVVDRYTQLTGRPRLPQKSLFGLHLSDKSDPDNAGESWWKQMITDHRAAGYAFDHQVNDNAWRASNEAVSGQMNSWFEWRADKFPDPAEYKAWCDANGVTVTLDLNRPGIPLNPSWDEALAIPGTDDCPDFTNPAARTWLWDLFFEQTLDPALGYPGDAIWLDEFDYPDHDHATLLFSGKSWAEESINYHLDLQKACVAEGWDPTIGETKRPYFWSRGFTAGAQRWGSYWTGDLDSNWQDMTYQVRAMQSAGISGVPYFNHDAGGHFNVTENEDNLYRQWDMAFGSFTPIWRPHGPGHKRWPLQRNATCQATATKYITARYELIPYIYSYARVAQATGMPIARPMFFEDPASDAAWQKDLQYYFGAELLVAPNLSDGNSNVSVWFPEGDWYDFWTDEVHAGGVTEDVYAATGDIPVFVKAGAIVPMAPFATSTFFIPKDVLVLHVFTGADGSFPLYEDDGVSERFRTAGESARTPITFSDADLAVSVGAVEGSYAGAPSARSYRIVYHGLPGEVPLALDGTALPTYADEGAVPANQSGAVWDSEQELLIAVVAGRGVDMAFEVSSAP